MKKSTFECELCQDTEFIITDKPLYTVKENGENRQIYVPVAEPCKCRELKYYKRIMEASGISNNDKTKTVNAYEPKSDKQKEARAIAIDYIKNFEAIKTSRNNSISLLGQPGSGKTHLTIAISNELLRRKIGVLYMPYREVVTHLKQVINNEEDYQSQIGRYKTAPVLLIDDLFKGATKDGRPNESEMRIMFELINHRYLKQLPILVSSEYFVSQLIDFDDATGSRIVEMCKGRIVELRGEELNHRMEGLSCDKD
jgi:DNA replication protein DnaC